MMSSTEQINDLDRRWADAERRSDVAALEALTTNDFTLVGPLGFVLDREQWLQRYRNGDLVTRSLRWDDVEVREYDGAAVAVGRHTQEASYRGTPADGSFRATHIAVRRDGRWLLAGMHLSPIGGPPPFARPSEG
jgi:ketosteroid isomerase-like protein